MQFSLAVGLVLRSGQKTFEYARELASGDIVLEDFLTRRPTVVSKPTLLRQVLDGKYVPVLPASLEAPVKGELVPEKLVDLSSLPEAARQIVEYRYLYVRSIHRAGVTRGNRKKIRALIKKTAEEIRDAKSPAASSVMDWLRRYERSGHNVASLIDGRGHTHRLKRIDETVVNRPGFRGGCLV